MGARARAEQHCRPGALGVGIRGLSRANAISLAQSNFGQYFDGLRLQAGGVPDSEVVRYLDDRAALVEPDGGGSEQIVTSTLPLLVEDPDGEKVPIDTSLTPTEGGFTPEAIGTELEFPRELEDGIEFAGEQAGIEFSGAEGASAPRTVEQSRAVVYGAADVDTDLILAPVTGGFRFAAQLRSARSPEQLVLPVDMPAGAELEVDPETDTGAVMVDDEPLIQISAPIATDADGRAVEASLAAVGDQLKIEIPHRGTRPLYPVYVDPTITSGLVISYDDLDVSPTARGWTYWEGGHQSGSPSEFNTPFVGAPSYGGLSSYATGPAFFLGDWHGIWSEAVPNFRTSNADTSAYYALVQFETTSFSPPPVAHNFILTFGLANPNASTYTDYRYYGGTYSAPAEQLTNSNTAAKRVQFEVGTTATTSLSNSTRSVVGYIGGIYTWIADGEAPSADEPVQSPQSDKDNWLSDLPTEATFDYRARDGGLGIKKMRFRAGHSLSQTPIDMTVVHPCDGWHNGYQAINNQIAVAACPQSVTHAAMPVPADAHAFRYDPTPLSQGINELYATPIDLVEKSSTTKLGEMRIDGQGPQVTVTGGLKDPAVPGRDLHIEATDGSSASNAAARSGVVQAKLEVDDPGSPQGTRVLFDRTQPNYTGSGQQAEMSSAPLKPEHQDFTLQASDGVAEGDRDFKLTVTDQAGNETIVEWTQAVDFSPPDTAITFGPSALSADPTPTFGFASTKTPSIFQCRFDSAAFMQCSGAGGTHTPAAPLTAGPHSFEVKAVDRFGNEDPTPAQRSFVLASGLVDDAEGSMLGLEQFFHYDSTETGLSAAHVNAHTGNAVWHSVPMFNPGRGLASVVNVTYNSYERPLGGLPDLTQIAENPSTPEGAADLVDLIDGIIDEGGQGAEELVERVPSSSMLATGYNTAGSGFSAGLSGVTRINEPLRVPGGVLPLTDSTKAQLTDADGTVHTFTLDEAASDTGAGRYVYQEPPGINLQLRSFVNGPTSTGQENNPRTWALTRPEGPTEFYDGWGFLRSIVDRDGNTMRFDYDRVNALTGDPCTTSVTPVLCEPRLARVVDAAGVDGTAPEAERSFTLDYNDYELAGLLSGAGAATQALLDRIAAGTLPVPGPSDGLLKSIEDHGNGTDPSRKLSFAYDEESGRLRSVVANDQAPEPANKRSWQFTYDEPAALTADQPQITEIRDPRGSVTELSYWGARPDFDGRQVRTVTNRNEHTRDYDLIALDTPAGARTMSFTDARGFSNEVVTDGEGRPARIVDPLGRVMTIGYDGDNNVSIKTQASAATGAPQTASWEYEWGLDGELESETDPIGRQTSVQYCVHDGTQVSPIGSDATQSFVVDMVAIQRPSGVRYEYGLDSGDPAECTDADKGHVTSSERPPGDDNDSATSASATYDGKGQLLSETNEAGEATTFSSYDPNGMPQVVVSPRGSETAANPNDFRTLYSYDLRGNVLGVVDPRGSPALGPGSVPAGDAPFKTTLTYDDFDQLRTERIPRDTSGAASEHIDTLYEYDLNGNMTVEQDGEARRTVTDFTVMDRPDTVTNAEEETVEYGYDAEESLNEITAPRGVASAAVGGDYKTDYRIDPVGRPVAKIQRSTDQPDLITSYAYDWLDNVTGVALPNDNSDAAGSPVSVETALARAADPARQRIAYDYDKASQLQVEIENPDGSCGSSDPQVIDNDQKRVTEFDYDDNGNRTIVRFPRAECSGNAGKYSTQTVFDDLDRPTQIIQAPGTLAYTTKIGYDPVGRTISEATPRGTATGDIAGDHTTTYDYDADGNLVSRSIPYSKGQYGIESAGDLEIEVTYGRDAVGNPELITDPRGVEITNTFYDTGELKSTNRPWWWRLDWSAPGAASPAAGKRFGPSGQGIGPDLAVPIGGPALAEGGPMQDGSEGEIPSGGLSGDFGSSRPESLPDFLPRSGRTEFDYDLVGRLETVKAMGDEPTRVSSIDYDEVGRIETKAWPYRIEGADSIDITHEFTYDKNGNLATYLDGAGSAPSLPTSLNGAVVGGLDPDDYLTRFDYDQFDRRISEQAPGSVADPTPTGQSLVPAKETSTYRYDPNGNVTSIETPRGASTMAPGDFELKFDYDDLDRLEQEVNGESESFRYGYDVDSNQTLVVDPLGRMTVPVNDELGRVDKVFEAKGTAVERTTSMTLDPEGNVTQTNAPGAAYEVGGVEVRRITDVAYDGLGRPWRTTMGSGAPAGSNSERTQITQRDQAGNVVREIGGLGASQSGAIGRLDPYDSDVDAGEIENATIHSTLHRYDADGLRKSTFLPHSGNEEHRYRTNFDHDGTGRLNGIDQAYDFTHSPDPGSPDFDQQARTTHVSYERFQTGWIRSSSDARDIAPGDGQEVPDQEIRYGYDERGFQTLWETDGFVNERDSSRRITRESYPSGAMYQRRGVKITALGGEDPSEDFRTYTYFYNPNRSLNATVDKIPSFSGAPSTFDFDRRTTIARDGAERELRVNESWRGGRDTTSSYDDAGNVLMRRTDGKLVDANGDVCAGAGAGCVYEGPDLSTTAFTYDALNRERTTQRDSNGETQSWRTNWWESDELKSRTRIDGALDLTEPVDEDEASIDRRFFWPSGDAAARVHDPDSEGPSTQTYAYDFNGNRTFDERGIHTYNARSQLIGWERADDSGPGAAPTWQSYADLPGPMEATGYTSYDQIDGTGKVLSETADLEYKAKYTDGTRPKLTQHSTTRYGYKNGYLRKVVSISLNEIEDHADDTEKTRTVSRYGPYDDLGNARRISVEAESLTPGTPDPPDPQIGVEPASVPGCEAEISEWTDSGTTYHCFDPFGRMMASQAPKPTTQQGRNPTLSYIYDGLDRRDVGLRSVASGPRSTVSERTYVGTAELLSRESNPSGEMEPRAYAYDSRGTRLGSQVKGVGPGLPGEFGGYSHDANGSVIGIEDVGTGAISSNDTYRFNPYGDLLDTDPGDEQTAEEALSGEAQSNPFRFEGFYFDSGIQSYDMQARQYRPEVGSFLSQDRFESAGADLALQSDPLTQNRYSFAGGNPVSNIEFDGHILGINKAVEALNEGVQGALDALYPDQTGPGPSALAAGLAASQVGRETAPTPAPVVVETPETVSATCGGTFGFLCDGLGFAADKAPVPFNPFFDLYPGDIDGSEFIDGGASSVEGTVQLATHPAELVAVGQAIVNDPVGAATSALQSCSGYTSSQCLGSLAPGAAGGGAAATAIRRLSASLDYASPGGAGVSAIAAREGIEQGPSRVPYTAGQRSAFEQQLQQYGPESLQKSRTTLGRRLSDHELKLEEIRSAGGYTSSVEREIQNFQGQIQVIDDLLGGL